VLFLSLSQKKLVSHMRGQWCFDLPDAALSASSRSECEWSRLYSRIASQIKELSRSAHVTGQSLQLPTAHEYDCFFGLGYKSTFGMVDGQVWPSLVGCLAYK